MERNTNQFLPVHFASPQLKFAANGMWMMGPGLDVEKYAFVHWKTDTMEKAKGHTFQMDDKYRFAVRVAKVAVIRLKEVVLGIKPLYLQEPKIEK